MGESNTVVSVYTMYRYLQQYCSHPSIYTSTCMQGATVFLKDSHTKPCESNEKQTGAYLVKLGG